MPTMTPRGPCCREGVLSSLMTHVYVRFLLSQKPQYSFYGIVNRKYWKVHGGFSVFDVFAFTLQSNLKFPAPRPMAIGEIEVAPPFDRVFLAS